MQISIMKRELKNFKMQNTKKRYMIFPWHCDWAFPTAASARKAVAPRAAASPIIISSRKPNQKSYTVRTKMNVQHSDGTLVLTKGPPEGGTQKTIQLCGHHKKPLLVLDLGSEPDVSAFRQWASAGPVATMNVAGPRESKLPGVYAEAVLVLTILLAMPQADWPRPTFGH